MLIRDGEWRLYLRDHKWWWKWPLVAVTMAVWLGAMVLFVAPWQSNNSIDVSQPEPVSTIDDDEDTTVGVREAIGDDFAADPLPDVDDVDVATTSPEPTAETEPPTDTEVATDTAATSKSTSRKRASPRASAGDVRRSPIVQKNPSRRRPPRSPTHHRPLPR